MHRLKDCAAALWLPGVLFPGLLLVVFNSITGHQLYHVNTLKLFLLGVMLTLLWGYSLFFHKTTAERALAAWQWGLLLFLPTLGFLPGGWFAIGSNVYFPIELVTDLLIVGWAVVLVRQIDSTKAVQGLVLWLVLVIIIVTLWLANQGFARHPLSGEFIIYNRPEGSFGNVNYLAGFLAVLTPVMVLLGLPEHVDNKWTWSVFNRLCCLGATGLIFCLLLAYSRAAIAATLVATMGSLMLVGLTSPLKPLKRLTRLVVLTGLSAVALVVITPFLAPDMLDLYPRRFAELYDIQAWWGRLVPMRGAVNSILASPFIGWGLGSSYNLNFNFLPPDATLYLTNLSYNHLHNEWLEMGQEGGALGLLVWGGVMTTLVVAMLRFSMRQQNHQLRFLALGVIGGLAAFYAHGIFSVAQRMIVANLPLYTLIGLAGAMLVNERKGKPFFAWNAHLAAVPQLSVVARHASSWQLVLVWTLALWLTFYPWIRSFSGMVQMHNSGVSLTERRDFFDDWPNPYGMSDLLNAQFSANRFADALETGRKLEAIIPNYRYLAARMGEAALNLGDLKEGKRLLQQQHELANYSHHTNTLLAAIALYEKDKQAFRTHIEALIVHALVFSHSDYDDADQIEFRNQGQQLMYTELEDMRVAVDLSDEYLDSWFALLGQSQFAATVQRQLDAMTDNDFFSPPTTNQARIFELIQQLLSEPQRIDNLQKQRQKAYQVANQHRNKSSFTAKADMERIRQDIWNASFERQNRIYNELSQILTEADLPYPMDGRRLYDRITVLQQNINTLPKVAQIANQLLAKKFNH